MEGKHAVGHAVVQRWLRGRRGQGCLLTVAVPLLVRVDESIVPPALELAEHPPRPTPEPDDHRKNSDPYPEYGIYVVCIADLVRSKASLPAAVPSPTSLAAAVISGAQN